MRAYLSVLALSLSKGEGETGNSALAKRAPAGYGRAVSIRN